MHKDFLLCLYQGVNPTIPGGSPADDFSVVVRTAKRKLARAGRPP